MATKNVTDLSNFDFGFSVVDEQELSAVTQVQQEVEAATSTSAQWQALVQQLHPGAPAGKLFTSPSSSRRATFDGVRGIAGRAKLIDRGAVGQLWRHRWDVEDRWVILSYLILS